MRFLFVLFFIANFSHSETYHFVSIDELIEQEVGRIILPQIYKKLGIDITITPLPGKRAQFEAVSGTSDGEVMRIFSYGQENPSVIRVPTQYYYLKTTAFIRKDSNIVVKSVEDLASYRVVKVRGVKHTNNITEGHPASVDLNTSKQMMKFLAAGRADIALTNRVDGLIAIDELGLDNIVPIEEPLARLGLYHYIHQGHHDLVARVDAVIKEMIISGELDTLIQDAESAITGK